MAFQLTPEQRAAVFDRGGELLVSAAAGSGKTRVLVERLLSYVEDGHDIDRFLVITYTRSAAAELRGRIVAELSDRMAQRPQDAFLRRQSTLVYKARISTVHAFCGDLLREEGHRLDLDRDFRLCDESEAFLLMEEVLNDVLDRRYEGIEADPDFAFLVDTMSAGRDDSRLMEIVLDIRSRIQSHPDPAGWLKEQERVFALEEVTDAGETPWGKLLLADVHRQADYWRTQMEEAAALCDGDEVLSGAYAPCFRQVCAGLEKLARATETGWDAAGARADVSFPRLGSSKGCGDEAAKERVKLLWDGCKKRIKRLGEVFQDSSAGLLEDMGAVYPALRALFALVGDFEAAYTAEKRRRNWLDFSDLEHLSVGLLVGEDGEPTDLARRWGERFDEVMVDEYQDTNAVQNALFTALTREKGNLFMVGDVKQSIYRFRLADPTIFLDKYRRFKPADRAEEGEPRRILLSKNFRSRPQVLEGCNYLFRSVMSVEFGEMDYTDDEALSPGGTISGEDDKNRVELDLLDCSLGGDDGADNGDGETETDSGPRPPRDLLEARFAASRIRELLDEKFPVSDGEGGARPVEAKDVVILLRSPGTVLHHYAAALSEQGLLWEAEGGGDFFETEEVRVALSLLQIVDNPRQDVSLIAALRSPVWAMTADRLSEIRSNAPEGDFYTALTLDEGEDARAFLAELSDLRRRSGDESCDRLIWRLYDRTDLLGIYGALEGGETRRANLLLLAQLARDYEGTGHKGLFDFLSYLRRLEESGGKLVLPKAGAAGEGVKILSIHKSKGLEFPVVLLCGLARQLNKTDMSAPVLFHPQLGVGPKRLDTGRMVEYPTLARLAVARQMEHELSAEELRLLYVAMTRAREKLILSCALTGGERDVEKLLPAAGTPVEPQALMERVSPAQWILLAALARPEARPFQNGAFPPPVAPGTDFGPAWDMRWVDATPFAAPPKGRGQAAEAEPRELDEALRDRLLERFTWTYPHAGDVELPSKLTATQLKGRDLDGEAAEDAPQQAPVPDLYTETSPLAPSRTPPKFDRPRFAAEKLGLTPTQRGTALHLVMQYIDFARCGSGEEVAGEIERLVAENFITPQQAEAVDPAKIRGFFGSDLGRELMAAPVLRREFKFSILVPAGRYFPHAGEGETVLLQGVVDCYFETANGITVVDFKTDHVYGDALTERAAAYAPQLTAYAKALGEITGKPVVRKVLWFFSEGRGVELK